MPPVATTLRQAFEIALGHHRAGEWRQAEHIYRQILANDPREPDALQLLGLIEHEKGRNEQAIQLIKEAVAINPDVAEYHNNLGIILRGAGRLEEAIAAYESAIRLNPDFADAHFNLGNALRDRKQLDSAAASYRRAIALKPQSINVYGNLAGLFRDQGLIGDALAAYQHITRLDPHSAEGWDGVGFCLAMQGRPEEAVAAYRRAVELDPASPEYHSHLIQTLLYDPRSDRASVLQECLRWNERHAEPLTHCITPHSNDRSPHRRLRIGYVSADFREHACAFYSEPLLAAHDPSQIEIFCYAEVERPDAITDRFRSLAHAWQNTFGLSDESLAERIRADQIDILVDLNLHTFRNRLLVFARKPAPVQMSWLGFPGPTGLSAIDCRISDPWLDTAGSSEEDRVICLPDTFWCYGPKDELLPVSDLPALQASHITFGSLNSFCKLNDGLLQLWAQLLQAVNGSRLILLADDRSQFDRVIEVMGRAGVASERISFEHRCPRADYLRLYDGIDIALDTFPYHGQTTSLDAMWMGVPVVTLAGQMPASRSGLSLLSNIGLPELVATNADDFLRIASSLAGDLDRLNALRSTLRERLKNSPVMDAQRFTRNMEHLYRNSWHRWCEGQ